MTEHVEAAVNMWVVGIPLIGLGIALVTHIFMMARWSGKVDANLTQIMAQPAQWQNDLNGVAVNLRGEVTAAKAESFMRYSLLEDEVKALRSARHDADGKIQQHEGAIREIGRRLDIHAERT